MQDGHFQFELGDNLASRCEAFLLILIIRSSEILSILQAAGNMPCEYILLLVMKLAC